MTRFRRLLILVALILASGCAIRAPDERPTAVARDAIDASQHADWAERYTKRREYQKARYEWMIAATLSPEHEVYRHKLDELNTTIETESRTLVNRARSSLEKDDTNGAEQLLLSALAINPDARDALDLLRMIQTNAMRERQLARLQQLQHRQVTIDTNGGRKTDIAQEIEYLQLGLELYKQNDWNGALREIDKYLRNHPENVSARKLAVSAARHAFEEHRALGQLELAKENLEEAIRLSEAADPGLDEELTELNLRLADEYYLEGVKLFRDNKKLAIEYWRKCLGLNPAHAKAKSSLEFAESTDIGL